MSEALMPTYARLDLRFERGEGPYLYDTDGRRYLDFMAGIGVNALGHAHPGIVAALGAQAAKLWHVSNIFRIPEQERLAGRLVEATFADRVFFSNSGSEAVECAVKTARKCCDERGVPERYRIITFEGCFHGRTLAAMAMAKTDKLTKGFGPMMDGFDQVPFDDIEALKETVGPETAAIIIEPVQGEGGVRVASEAFLRALREVCDEHGLLLIFDEVQCGMGRTGRLFAHEWAGVAPDIMAVAKALGGGVPVGAGLATEAAAAGMTTGTHGSTYGGNPLAMAVGNEVLGVMLEDGFLDNVGRVANFLHQQLGAVLEEHGDVIEEVRGRGLMIGLKCRCPAAEMVDALRGKGLLTVAAAEDVVRWLPPLIIGQDHAREALDMLGAACAELKG